MIRITKINSLIRETPDEIVLLCRLHIEKKLLISKDGSPAVRTDKKNKNKTNL